MSEKPKLSIIIPIYNAERYLERCMDSICAQTMTDYEVLLVDDGSTDRSAAICDEYERRDSRVRAIHKPNGGAGSARNAGIEAARGAYLAFPDADDWFDPKMYETMYQTAVEGDFDLVLCGLDYYRQTADGLQFDFAVPCPVAAFWTAEACRENFPAFFPNRTTVMFNPPWNKLYKKSVIDRYGLRFTNLRRAQDAVFNLDFYDRTESVAGVPETFYHYMANTEQDTQRKFPKNMIDIVIAYQSHLIDRVRSWGIYRDAAKMQFDSGYVNQIYETVQLFGNPNWHLSCREKRQYIQNALNRPELESFLPTATVYPELSERYEQLLHKQYRRIVRTHRIEAFKAAVRRCKPLIGLYRKLRGPDR